MEEATTLCDRVAIMHQGRILSLDSPQELISRYVGNEVWEIEVDSKERSKIVKELENRRLDFEDTVDKIHVFHIESDESLTGLMAFASRLRQRSATLEDVFFRLTGRSLLE
jgi:lipooligosaccharide transport system ATP-binding protein